MAPSASSATICGPISTAGRSEMSSIGNEAIRHQRRFALHCQFGLETFDIAIDRGDRQHASIALIAQQAILRHDIAVDRQFVPFLGMADVVYRDVIVLTPKEWHGDEPLSPPDHVERSGLALALGDNTVIDA